MKSLFVLLAILDVATGARYGGGHGQCFVCRRGSQEPDVFQGTSLRSGEATFGRHHQRSSTKHEYVRIVICFLDAAYWQYERPASKTDVVLALELIYEMLHKNFHGLVVFTSHVVFGTGGFLRLQAGRGQWTSRGILQITGMDNYRKLARITNNDFFLRNPKALATLQHHAVEASVLFWLCLLKEHFGDYRQAEITFWETLHLLNPNEARRPWFPANDLRIRNRKTDYYALLNEFDRLC